MKNKIISIILLFISLFITGCGTEQTSVEPTEVVIETETEEPTETLETTETTETTETEDNKLFDPDKVGSDRDNFWFEDQATIDYLMGISGVSELPEEQLNQFMSDIAEMVYIDEFGGDIGKIEDYIQTVLPVYQQQSSTTKNSSSDSTDTKANNNSSSTKSNNSNTQQQETSNNNNESTSSNNTDNNINQSEGQDINNNKVGTGDQYFFQDDPANWGEYTGERANLQN